MKQVLLCSLCAIGATTASAVTDIRDSLYSQAMDKPVEYVIVLPEAYFTQPDSTFPVLYALHGQNSPYHSWAVMAPLNYAIDHDYPAVIVTFQAGDSFYIDKTGDEGRQYTTFFFEELVPFIESTYRIGGQKEFRAVTGFSMGGFGAWHYALERPGFFSSVSSLSGGFDFSLDPQVETNPYPRVEAMAADGMELPPFYLNCGTEDFLIEDNRQMAAHIAEKGYSATLVETPDHGHNWAFWKGASTAMLAWHYQYLSGPMDTDIWHGYQILPDDTVDTGSMMARIYIAADPWIWMYSISNWAYFHDSIQEKKGAWIYLIKNK